MFTTQAQALEEIRLGNGQTDLKPVHFVDGQVGEPTESGLADEIAAFANAHGGLLFLGVDDVTREVTGVPLDRLDAVQAIVERACHDSITPEVAPLIQRMMLPDDAGTAQPVVRIEVPRSVDVHHSPGGYLHRVGGSKRPIPHDHLPRLIEQRSRSRLVRFDGTALRRATIADLDENLWRRFWGPQAMGTREEMLSKLGMVSRDEAGTWHPTIAGVLLACPAPERFLPNARIQAVAYWGEDVVPRADRPHLREAEEITGPLDRQVFDACAFVRKNMHVAARQHPDGGREDMPQFDLIAVFEAIANAVAHRDYSMLGSKIRLRLFDNRMELYVPGMLPDSMTAECLPHRRVACNEAITRLLARCPMERVNGATLHRTHVMDNRGEGVPLIRAKTAELAGEDPVYRMIGDAELVLVIPAARFRDPAAG